MVELIKFKKPYLTAVNESKSSISRTTTKQIYHTRTSSENDRS